MNPNVKVENNFIFFQIIVYMLLQTLHKINKYSLTYSDPTRVKKIKRRILRVKSVHLFNWTIP